VIDVKNLVVAPISSVAARSFVKKHHYSGKVMNSSWLHLGVFHDGTIGGVMQFGTPINKRRTIQLVKDTKWKGMLELSRMVYADWLPKNSESRTLAVAVRLIKKTYPQVEWILSFADACQCGDGTIYRATGFLLLRIQKNKTVVRLKSGEVSAKHGTNINQDFSGSTLLIGNQLMYLLPLNNSVQERLQIDIIPYAEIDKRFAGMYKGQSRSKH